MLQELPLAQDQVIFIPDVKEGNREVNYLAKRGMDFVVSTIMALVLSPVMLVIAILIKLDSPGKSLFVQDRVGARRCRLDGRAVWRIQNFKSYKFRTMVENADPRLHQAHVHALACAGSSKPMGASFKLMNDPRVTRLGRILRKTSLDELPQLFNVIRGEMSLVGPRPVPPYEVAEYKQWQRERLGALPGITGLWQVAGRGQVTFDEMIRMDIEYIHKQSLWLDLRLLVLTVPAVLSRRGAH